MNRTQVYLPKSQLTILRKEAQKKDTTVSEVIRTLIQENMVRHKIHSLKKHETLIQAAKRINALDTKGPRDLASRVDKYLYGKI